MVASLLSRERPGEAHVDARLRTEPTIWLGTVSDTGQPHSVPVWFGWADPVITCFCDPATAKVKHLRRSGLVAVSLDTAVHGTDVVLGEGVAALVRTDAVRDTMPSFESKYAPMLGGQPLAQWLATFSQPVRITLTRLIAWRRSAEGVLDYRSLPPRGPVTPD